jgi:hypothetical protein
LVPGEWNIGSAKWSAGQVNGMAAWRNGALIAERDAYNTVMPAVPLWIGSSRGLSEFTQADIAEILVYNAALSDDDRVSVQEYLAGKYALPGAFDPASIAGLQLWLKADSGIGESSFYGFDERGNTRVLVAPSGGVTDAYLYDGFGSQLAASGSTPNAFRYGGAFGYVFDFVNVTARWPFPISPTIHFSWSSLVVFARDLPKWA